MLRVRARESEAKDIGRAGICLDFLELLTTCGMPMTSGRGCLALAVLLVIADIQLSGCMDISSSVSQEGKKLNLICTVRHKEGEAEGVVVFLCKNRTWDCSPETSLEQLRVKQYRGPDGGSERSSQLVFTIDRATPSNSGVYQCCARSQKPDVHLQGHFFSLSVTETGNYTVTGLKGTGRRELSHSQGALSSGFRQETLWAMLVTSLVALQEKLYEEEIASSHTIYHHLPPRPKLCESKKSLQVLFPSPVSFVSQT